MSSLQTGPTPFEGVEFDDYEIEQMVTEVGDVLVFLQHEKVIDYKESETVQLLDKQSTRIEFAKTEEMEVKRFIALVGATRNQLRYMAMRLTKHNEQVKTPRSDRIMGAVSYSDTSKLRGQRPGSKAAVLWEIRRSLDTPENKLLALVLFSIVIYCERYLPDGRLQNGKTLDSTTLVKLAGIRSIAIELLKTPSLRNVLPAAIREGKDVKRTFVQVQHEVRRGLAPSFFAGLPKILYAWKYYLWVVGGERDALRRALYYHFWLPSPMNRAQLYQAWVGFVVLKETIIAFDLHMTKVPGELAFVSADRGFKIHFQRRYPTGLVSDGNPIIDQPDIAVEIGGKTALVVDAKNNMYSPQAYEYREKMQSYLRSTGARYAIVMHSRAPLGLWRIAEGAGQDKIIWSHLIPPTRTEVEARYNRESINHILECLPRF